MNRRHFLRNLVGGVATAAAVRTFPFRVFSFPPEPVTATLGPIIAEYADYTNFSEFASIYYDKPMVQLLKKNLVYQILEAPRPYPAASSRGIHLFRYPGT